MLALRYFTLAKSLSTSCQIRSYNVCSKFCNSLFQEKSKSVPGLLLKTKRSRHNSINKSDNNPYNWKVKRYEGELRANKSREFEMETLFFFLSPKNILNNVCNQIVTTTNDNNLKLTRKYTQITSNCWECTYILKWPCTLEITQKANNQKEASYRAALSALVWLKENNYINKNGKPCINIKNNLKAAGTNQIHTDLLGQFQIKNSVAQNKFQSKICGLQVTISNNNALQNNLTRQVRSFAVTSSNDEEQPIQHNTKDAEHAKQLFPMPKSILHNIYDVVAKELEKPEYKAVPQFKLIKHNQYNNWVCIYHLKWPENIKFSYTCTTKQEASNKAALEALIWLKQNKKITKQGQPILLDNASINNIVKQTSHVLTLSTQAESKLKEIVDIYEQNFEKILVKSIDDVSDVDQIQKEQNIEEKWPKRNVQKFINFEFYKAKEDVSLPITDYRNNIMKVIDNNQVVVIRGEPGCGKSTRVPQYILENWAKEAGANGEPCRIIITQPRRIAAISLAERVANERYENVGNTVGYQVRLKSNFNNRIGRIMFCTTGILLRRLQSNPTLNDCTHILLDEAHERDVNTDLLMNLLRQSLELNPNLKLVIMSATIDTKLFENYFNEAAVMHIPGFTYPVKEHFLNDNKNLDLSKTRDMCDGNTLNVVYEDVVKVINFLHNKRKEGAILCFLPGWEDIFKIKNLLTARNMQVLCLHSRLQDSDQKLIFSKPPPGVRKVILSTNVAETSVTIDDVVYVIDTGIHKEQRFDVEKGIMCIDNHWISQANMIQRKGRAGRVQAGESYHLYPKSIFDKFHKYSMPEILRTSLTKIVLDSKVYSNNMDAVQFLGQLPTPPETNTILKAVEELTDLELLDENENLTSLGRTLSEFQLEPKLAKAMVNAVIFKCVTPVVDVITLFSAETELFSSALINKQGVQKVKKEFSKYSDHMSMMRIFEKWLEFFEDRNNGRASSFCIQNDLLEYKLHTIKKLRELHFQYLHKGLKDVLPLSDDFSDSDELVKGVLLSGVGTLLQHRNWDVVKGRMKKVNVLLTRFHQRATITSESVNFKRTKFPSDFLLYINETRSNIRRTTLIRETSLISPVTVLLFKNKKITIEELADENKNTQDEVLLKLEGTKIQFICDRSQAILLKKSKDALEAGLQYFVFQLTEGGEYDSKLSQYWKKILNNLNEVLHMHRVI